MVLVLLCRETPCLREEAVLVGEGSFHPIQIPREPILTTNFIHPRKVICLLKWRMGAPKYRVSVLMGRNRKMNSIIREKGNGFKNGLGTLGELTYLESPHLQGFL